MDWGWVPKKRCFYRTGAVVRWRPKPLFLQWKVRNILQNDKTSSVCSWKDGFFIENILVFPNIVLWDEQWSSLSEAQHGRFRFRPSSGCPMTSRAQLEVQGAERTFENSDHLRFGPLQCDVKFGTCLWRTTDAWSWPQDWSIQWMKKMLLEAFSCRINIKSLEHLLWGRCSLQLLVGTFGRGRVVAASTFAHAVSAPAHGWSWRLFLGIGSTRWRNWNARLRFQVSRNLEQELRKLGALDLSTSNQLSHSLFHSSWKCSSTGWKCSETVLHPRSMARPYWRPRLCWCLCTANPWERWWAFCGMGCGRHVLHPSQKVLGMFTANSTSSVWKNGEK